MTSVMASKYHTTLINGGKFGKTKLGLMCHLVFDYKLEFTYFLGKDIKFYTTL